jgi:translocation protein SEC72
MAASIAVQRPPWENNHIMREELSTVLSNRSAAYFESADYIGALVDAETVISLKRNWSKGHFRKAKALLGLGKWEEAKDAVRLGLQYEPSNQVSASDGPAYTDAETSFPSGINRLFNRYRPCPQSTLSKQTAT